MPRTFHTDLQQVIAKDARRLVEQLLGSRHLCHNILHIVAVSAETTSRLSLLYCSAFSCSRPYLGHSDCLCALPWEQEGLGGLVVTEPLVGPIVNCYICCSGQFLER